MNKNLFIIALFGMAIPSCSACGTSSKSSELTGQVKKVIQKTPIFCPDYALVDISLGVVRNGTGSMSHEDVELYVKSDADVALLKKASESGQLVRAVYDVERLTWCLPDHWMTSVNLVDDATPVPKVILKPAAELVPDAVTGAGQ